VHLTLLVLVVLLLLIKDLTAVKAITLVLTERQALAAVVVELVSLAVQVILQQKQVTAAMVFQLQSQDRL
jgi:hypothetical protein